MDVEQKLSVLDWTVAVAIWLVTGLILCYIAAKVVQLWRRLKSSHQAHFAPAERLIVPVRPTVAQKSFAAFAQAVTDRVDEYSFDVEIEALEFIYNSGMQDDFLEMVDNKITTCGGS